MKRQRGIALITAIFVVALASIAAVGMFEAANISVHRSANLVQSEAELWYATGVESWVKGILIQDAKLNKQTVGFNGMWAQPVDFLPIDGGGIRGHIVDLQGRFNLNNLGVGTLNTNAGSGTVATGAMLYIQQFDRLLDNLPNFNGSKYHGMGYAIRDWIDADDQRSGTNGAEDQDYLSQDPPYRAANQPFRSVSELMLVKGMTKELYTALRPYVAALPIHYSRITVPINPANTANRCWRHRATVTPINVNTAPEPVLLSPGPQHHQQGGGGEIHRRAQGPAGNTGSSSPSVQVAPPAVLPARSHSSLPVPAPTPRARFRSVS